MFKARLEQELKSIFKIKKVSYSLPSESNEQDTLFVSIASTKPRPNENEIIDRIYGKITLFASQDKLPFGFFVKQIHTSTVDDKNLFFYNIEENSNYQGAVSLVERSADL